METDKLTCTKIVKRDGGFDNQKRRIWYHEKCGLPASEVEIGGTLTKAKAILCAGCKRKADAQAFTSVNGYPLGKISKKAKKDGYQQPRLPGTGLLTK